MWFLFGIFISIGIVIVLNIILGLVFLIHAAKKFIVREKLELPKIFGWLNNYNYELGGNYYCIIMLILVVGSILWPLTIISIPIVGLLFLLRYINDVKVKLEKLDD